MAVQPLLFNRLNIFNVVENQKAALKQAVQGISQQEIENGEQQVVARLVQDFSITVPVLDESDAYTSSEEADVELSGMDRFIFGDFESRTVRGAKITVHLPFHGEGVLFDVRPTTFTLNPPRGEVVGQELQLVFRVVHANTDIKAEYDRAVRSVNDYLGWLRQSAEQLKNELPKVAASAIAERKQQFGARANLVAALGLPLKQAAAAAPLPGPPPAAHEKVRKRPTAAESDERWDVFISHAHEDKTDVARPLAEALIERGLRVWYDEFSLKLGDSLRQSIDRGLGRSRYGVVILSPHFFEKHWPVQELNGLATREVNGDKVILPVWHNVGHNVVAEFSAMLADRVAANTGNGLERVIGQIMSVCRK